MSGSAAVENPFEELADLGEFGDDVFEGVALDGEDVFVPSFGVSVAAFGFAGDVFVEFVADGPDPFGVFQRVIHGRQGTARAAECVVQRGVMPPHNYPHPLRAMKEEHVSYEDQENLRAAAAELERQAKERRREANEAEADDLWRAGERGQALVVCSNTGIDLLDFCRRRGLSEDQARAEIRNAPIDWT